MSGVGPAVNNIGLFYCKNNGILYENDLIQVVVVVVEDVVVEVIVVEVVVEQQHLAQKRLDPDRGEDGVQEQLGSARHLYGNKTTFIHQLKARARGTHHSQL